MPRFAKGSPPGPGRPPGSRNKSSVWLDELGNDGLVKVVRAVVDQAVTGNMTAAKIALERVTPSPRGRLLTLDLPAVDTPAGLVRAQAAVVAAMASGEITPEEAASVASLLDSQRRAIETCNLDVRITALEEREVEAPATPSAAL
jgi:hypothetical protein